MTHPNNDPILVLNQSRNTTRWRQPCVWAGVREDAVVPQLITSLSFSEGQLERSSRPHNRAAPKGPAQKSSVKLISESQGTNVFTSSGRQPSGRAYRMKQIKEARGLSCVLWPSDNDACRLSTCTSPVFISQSTCKAEGGLPIKFWVFLSLDFHQAHLSSQSSHSTLCWVAVNSLNNKAAFFLLSPLVTACCSPVYQA